MGYFLTRDLKIENKIFYKGKEYYNILICKENFGLKKLGKDKFLFENENYEIILSDISKKEFIKIDEKDIKLKELKSFFKKLYFSDIVEMLKLYERENK